MKRHVNQLLHTEAQDIKIRCEQDGMTQADGPRHDHNEEQAQEIETDEPRETSNGTVLDDGIELLSNMEGNILDSRNVGTQDVLTIEEVPALETETLL